MNFYFWAIVIYLGQCKMRIQLIHPPHPDAIEDRLDAPLGLLYIASTLRKAGHDVAVTDLSGVNKEDWIIPEVDIYGISTYVATVEIAEEIAMLCRLKNPKAIIVAGGAHITGALESGNKELLPHGFDSLISGSGELAMLELIEDYPNIKPLYEQDLSRDLDIYPNPAYDLVDLKSYKRRIGGRRSISMLTSRGCPFRCAFCGLSKQHKRIKLRSPEAVADEMQLIMVKYGIKAFNFQDDTFMLDRDRMYRLLDLIEPLKIYFRCHGRVGINIKEDYVRLKKAGCRIIGWGIESGSQDVLDRMNKGITVEQNIQAIRWAQEAGITDRAFIIAGFPGETKATLEETKRFIDEANPSQLFVSTFQPYPGTDVWKHPSEYGITSMSKDFSKYLQVKGHGEGGGINFDTEWMRREEMDKAIDEFRLWVSARGQRGPVQGYEKKLKVRNE